MSDQLVVEREGLEKKDKSELQTIVAALGGSATTRTRKAELIDMILDLSGATARAGESGGGSSSDSSQSVEAEGGSGSSGDTKEHPPGRSSDVSAQKSESGSPARSGEGSSSSSGAGASGKSDQKSGERGDEGSGSRGRSDGRSNNSGSQRGNNGRRTKGSGRPRHPMGPDGEPLADWEIQVLEESDGTSGGDGGNRNRSSSRNRSNNSNNNGNGGQSRSRDGSGGNQGKGGNQNNNKQGDKDQDDDDQGNRRQRRRNRGRGRDRDDAGDDPVSDEPITVEGFLDLRDEGYAFLRVNGFLPSKDDAYVSVKQVRQFKLRKGDHVVGCSRPANRNEKNPALHEIESINGKAPGEVGSRANFEELTPLFPDERLKLEMKDEPLNMTARIIDLLAPIGKGQRGLIVSPPKAGKTSIMKNIARAIETNNPEVELLVLLVDERPEEVTDMVRSLERGEVVSSTFDRPAEEHTAIAELTLERAKRVAEDGGDVCLIIDGITRLARAYNMAGPQSGKALSGGIDAAALYPPKRFLGAARNFEEGGSLTILATALVETGSKMDEVIFEECKGTGNMELRLNRRLAEKRIFPAIDIDGSSTRNEELLRSKKDVEASWKLRRLVDGLADGESSNAAGIEMLVERLGTFKTNDDFLAEIARAGSV